MGGGRRNGVLLPWGLPSGVGHFIPALLFCAIPLSNFCNWRYLARSALMYPPGHGSASCLFSFRDSLLYPRVDLNFWSSFLVIAEITSAGHHTWLCPVFLRFMWCLELNPLSYIPQALPCCLVFLVLFFEGQQ